MPLSSSVQHNRDESAHGGEFGNFPKKMKLNDSETRRIKNADVDDKEITKPLRRSTKKYSIIVYVKDGIRKAPREAIKSLYTQLMEQVGFSGSQITTFGSLYFFANITEEEALKLSGIDCVKQVKPVAPLLNVNAGFELRRC